MLLETLYRPIPKELLAGINQKRLTSGQKSGTAASINVNATGDTCPPGVAWFIDTITLSLAPGAAQVAKVLTAQIQQNGIGTMIARYTPVPLPAAADAFAWTWLNLGWVLFPGEFILGNGIFSAGAAANSTFLYYTGFEVPRANLEF